MQEILENIYDFFTGDISESLIETFLGLISSFFDLVCSFFYNLIFVDLKEGTLTVGKSIFKFFSENFFDKPFDFSYAIIFMFGFSFVIFIIGILVRLVRG